MQISSLILWKQASKHLNEDKSNFLLTIEQDN